MMEANAIYEIRLKGYLSQQWVEWFDPLVIEHTPAGETLLTGPIRDQAELYGLLLKLRDLNLTLVAVNRLATGLKPSQTR